MLRVDPDNGLGDESWMRPGHPSLVIGCLVESMKIGKILHCIRWFQGVQGVDAERFKSLGGVREVAAVLSVHIVL